MKIEVTFDKTARKEFREQCIKRLQNFVSQIRGRQAVSDTARNRIVSKCFQDGRNSSFRQHTLLIKEEEDSIARYSCRDSKMPKKMDSFENGENQTQPCTPKESRKQNMPPKHSQINLKANEAFNIKEMRENVNKILQKLEKSNDIQQSNQESIEEKMDLTNRKLDYLIQCIQTKKITENQSKRSKFYPNQQQRQGSSSFQEQFDKLAKRYYQIKQRGSRSSNLQAKSITSLQQTQDSVAFRQGRQ